MAGKEPQAPILAVSSQPAAARHDIPLPPMPPLGPTHGAMQEADPNAVWARFGSARPCHQLQVQLGGSMGGPGTPSMPSQKARAAQDFHRWHMVNHSKSPGIPDPSRAGSPGWALCPEALGMGISAFSHWQEWAPGTLPAQLLPVCTRSAQATSQAHCPRCRAEGNYCRRGN